MATSRRGPFSGAPLNATSPAVGANKPVATRKAVVLPHPEGPTIQTISPRAIAKLSLESTSLPAKARSTAENRMSASWLTALSPPHWDRQAPACHRDGRRVSAKLRLRGASRRDPPAPHVLR